ncbi:MAG: zf-TFIIB domain-containing protein [Deltaproteobacteria bacterium]|nr:zf-TFIIB domain-containing protein [Deltaproteobacteria bacterium]
MKLVACPQCHAQYDLSARPEGGTFACRCGQVLEAKAPSAAVDAAVERCSACGAIAKQGEESCAFCGSGIVPSADPGSLICPECFARNHDDARFCAGCGVGFAPMPIPEDPGTAVRCPCCERPLHAREAGGIVVHECGKCHGLWAPQDRFRALIERAAETARNRFAAGEVAAPRVEGGNPSHSQVEYRRCPVCRELMARRNYQRRSGVIIDQCHEHGTWLDANELERIAGYVLSGRAQRVADAEADRERRREQDAADEAVRRVTIMAKVEKTDWSVFGERRPTTLGVGSIVDFLARLLD